VVVHASELQVSSAARRPVMTGAFTQGMASYPIETDDTVTHDAHAGYRVEVYNDLIHRAKVHQPQALSGTTGDLT
jgi:hypothetical protein